MSERENLENLSDVQKAYKLLMMYEIRAEEGSFMVSKHEISRAKYLYVQGRAYLSEFIRLTNDHPEVKSMLDGRLKKNLHKRRARRIRFMQRQWWKLKGLRIIERSGKAI